MCDKGPEGPDIWQEIVDNMCLYIKIDFRSIETLFKLLKKDVKKQLGL